jgi:hypothetical protein
MLIVILKILSLADKPMAYVWANLQAMWWNPFAVVNSEFYMMLMLALISWLVATNTIADFEALYDPFTFRSARIVPLDRLASRFFWGGIFLVAISGLTQLILKLGISSLIDFRRPTVGGIIINVLIYFALGLVLLSQANLVRLMMSWRIHKVEIGPGLVKQWAKYGLIFLGFVTFIVFFLPTSYTLGFLRSAAIVIGRIIYVVNLIFQLLMLLIALPLTWLLSLLGGTPEESEVVAPQVIPQSEPTPDVAPIPWLEALRSLVFWLLALAIVWYFLRVYLADHPELLAALKKFKPVSLIIRLWHQLWQLVKGWAQTGYEVISERIRLPGQTGGISGSGGGWNWFGLGKLSARERILYYYLNILKRAERRKLRRKTYQTPYEYEPSLEQVVPDAQPEVEELTDVFVRARYSQERFDEEQAASVKQQWQRIRKELRHSSAPKKDQDSGE